MMARLPSMCARQIEELSVMSVTSVTSGSLALACFATLMPAVPAYAGTQVLPLPGADITHPTGVPPTLSVWTRTIGSMQGDSISYNTISDYNFNYSVTTVVTILGPGEYAGNNQLIFPFRRLVTVARGGVVQVLEDYTGRSTASEGFAGTHSVAWTAHTESANPAANRFDSFDSATGTVSLSGEDAVDAIHAALAKVRGRPENAPAYGQFYYPGEVSNVTTSQLQFPASEVLREWAMTADYWPYLEFDDAEKPEAFLRTPTGSSKAFQKVQYKFVLTPATPLPLVWTEVFTPKNQGGAKHHTFFSWTPMPDETESPIYTIDPLGLDSLDAHAVARHPAIDGSYEISVLTASLAVDANRDGEIKFAHEDASDSTSKSQPFLFWLNDDIDRVHTFTDSDPDSMADYTETEEDDIGPAEAQQRLWNADCWTNNKADSKRDLEDFTRLQIYTAGLNNSFKNGQLFLGLKWADVTGTPGIRVYKQHNTTGGLSYLTDEAEATAQVAEYAIRDARYQNENPSSSLHAMVHGTETFILPSSLFANLSESNPKTHLLFEGVKTGKGHLKLVILKPENGAYTEIGDGPGVWMDLKTIGDMYEHWSVGNASGGAPNSIAARIPSLTGSGTAFRYDNPHSSPEEGKYILFVHGWNMEQWEKERFAETAYKRLWWQGYKGRFGLFSWPCTNRFDETSTLGKLIEGISDGTHFDRGEWTAWRSGAPLRQLLQALNGAYSGQLYVFSHSMGGIAMSEALRLQSDAGGGQLVNVYVASQAAVSAHLYDGTLSTTAGSASSVQWQYDHPSLPRGSQNYGPQTTNVYRNWLAYLLNGSATSSKAVGTLVNFYNQNDWALAAPVWQFNQITKPDWPDVLHGQPWTYVYTGDPAYFEDAFTKRSWDTSYPLALGGRTDPQDRHEIMAFAAESYVKAFGATPNTSQGVTRSFDVRSIWPTDIGDHKAHIWHSGQFRSNMPKQKDYWKALLGDQAFDITTTTLP
jgi:hypothetical protein